jgi:beta-lactamase regulating signal transducer with metallopeptidase domain/protocatechuate 3,4-dioxygenase beta subunit
MAARPVPVRPTDAWRLAAMAAAVAWAAVVLALLSRLAGGWLTLSRLRLEAVAVDRESDRLLGECRSALGLSRPVRVAMHPAVASPAVVGGPRPIVLVPTDWGDWPESHRRACLLHELAHLSRYDDWAKLAQELLRAPFFFHPAVRWLFARLDRERELLCDEAVVALGSDPVAYARLLLEMARRPGRLIPVTLPVRPGWLPFLERRTVKVRIERLLEDDMLNTLSRSRPSAARSLLLGGLAVAAVLLVGGLRVRAGSDGPTASPSKTGPQEPAKAAAEKGPAEYRGVVLDPDGRPIPGATIVAGTLDPDRSGHRVFTTDDQGRFTWKSPPEANVICLVAHKEGFAASELMVDPKLTVAPHWLVDPHGLKLRLGKPADFSAVLVDAAGKPVAGATARVQMSAQASEQKIGDRTSVSVGYSYYRRELLGGSPLERLFVATADASGAFAFHAFGPDAGLKLAVTTADGRAMLIRSGSNATGMARRSMEEQGFATAPTGEPARLVVVPAARVTGRVVTKLPGVRVSGLTASYQASRSGSSYRPTSNFGANVPADADGRFTLDGLGEGTVNVFVHGDGENRDWTYRAAQDVALTPGATADVTIELIRGVEVEGTVVAEKTGAPIEGAEVGVYGPFRPRSGAMTSGVKTDAQGRYHYRLPSGETYFYASGPPTGFTRLPGEGSNRTVTIPDGASNHRVPPIELATAVTVRGRVLDVAGAPIAGATVVGTCEGGMCQPFPGTETVTDARGEFRLPPSLYNTVAIGRSARLLIRLRGGAEHELAAVPTGDGSVTLKLPVGGEMTKGVEAPRDVAPDELAGVVVDTQGKPIGGAEVDAWTWYPGHEATTNARGLFRIRRLDKGRKVEVLVRKPGYTPQLFLMQPPGQPGWVIVLGNKTYFEGRVLAPGGKPVAGARIRANNGPKRADGVMISELWTEATTDQEGRYRMYAQADVYDIQVRVPGVGVARRPKTSLEADEAKQLDIDLTRAVIFRAEVVDSLTGDPVPGVRLWHWQHPGIEGRSQADGMVEIPDMMPGPFQFMVEAPGYARWWSEEASSEWSRRKIDETRGGWQRNFDHLDFALQPDMKPVTITVERGVTVTGRVLAPDGKPVAGATVAPALTGTGNSLTGDTRFSVETGQDGRFTATLPASGAHAYNLVAHDGKYDHWRTWANGVRPPFRTKPGEEVRDVEIWLTRPATVRGRVTDASGQPVPDREVRTSAADRLENRYYDPTTATRADGTYELKFIRPGQQFIQVAPFWLDAREAPEGTNQTLTLRPGDSKDGVDFRVPSGGPK